MGANRIILEIDNKFGKFILITIQIRMNFLALLSPIPEPTLDLLKRHQ